MTTGRVVLAYNRNGVDAYVMHSDNNGLTWSAPTNITASVKQANWGGIGFGPGHAIQLQRGLHAGRLIIAGKYIRNDVNLNPLGRNAYISYSDDCGQTWQIGGLLINTNGDINPNESTAVELIDGSIYVNSRNQGGAYRRRLTGYSRDGGLTFDSAAQVEQQLVDPTVAASVARFSSIDRGD